MTSENLYCIYKHTSPSGKSYIGQTFRLVEREKEHQTTNHCPSFRGAIDKYGWDNFTHEILEEELTLEEANEREEYYISFYNSLVPNGYNLQSGGLNSKMSEETCKKMAISHTGKPSPMLNKSHTEETKQHLSEVLSGENSPWFGREHTTDTIKLQSELKKGKNNPMYGRTGKDCPSYGKDGENSFSAKSYIITFPDGNEEIIKGLSKFCREHKINQAHMSVRGKTKGYKCKPYIEEDSITQ